MVWNETLLMRRKKSQTSKNKKRSKRRWENPFQRRPHNLRQMKERTDGLENALNSTQPLDDLNQKEAELKKTIEQDQAIINDPDASPSEKQEAGRKGGRKPTRVGGPSNADCGKRRRASLRERVKKIFKKHGVTVTAIFLAAGVTIGAVLGTMTNWLKAVGKGTANGMKTIRQKMASLLPGLIGSIFFPFENRRPGHRLSGRERLAANSGGRCFLGGALCQALTFAQGPEKNSRDCNSPERDNNFINIVSPRFQIQPAGLVRWLWLALPGVCLWRLETLVRAVVCFVRSLHCASFVNRVGRVAVRRVNL